jgi:transposase
MVHVIEGLADDWRRLDECIEGLSTEIGALACQDPACDRLMTAPGIGPIVSSAMVAPIGNGAAFAKGRDFGAWLGLVMTANASWPLSQRQALRDLDRPGVPTVEKPVQGASVG